MFEFLSHYDKALSTCIVSVLQKESFIILSVLDFLLPFYYLLLRYLQSFSVLVIDKNMKVLNCHFSKKLSQKVF